MDDHETDIDDLVERLEDSKGWPNLGKAAAARIRALEAKNARLRGALDRIQARSYGKNAAMARTALAEREKDDE